MALELGMNQNNFAILNGLNNPVLEESWRRTWWLVYITDAHIAGSTHTYPFRTSKINVTVDLPCEEQDYESGQIPPPRTLQEYDIRKFTSDDGMEFSSYAELIGLTRGIDIVLASGPASNANQTSTMCANADTSIAAWHSLLPSCKKDILRGDSSVDEVLFKAHFILHAYTVEMHRQLSTLAYSPIEATCKCSPPPPPECLRGCNTPECQLRTLKCLRAIEKLDRLMTLPTNIATHTPFIICMIANATIAHLSACRYVYQGEQLKLGREKIRLSMGTLKVLSEHWPQGKRIYHEVGIIAKEILSLSTTSVEAYQISSAEPVLPDLEQDNTFDFGGLFDFNFPDVVEPAAELVV